MATRAITVVRPRVIRRTSVRRMVARRRTKVKTTLPLGIIAGFAPLIFGSPNGLVEGFRVDGVKGVVNRIPGLWGIETDGSWQGWDVMKRRGTPSIIGGFAAHWIANKVGLNRAISRARIPFVRI